MSMTIGICVSTMSMTREPPIFCSFLPKFDVDIEVACRASLQQTTTSFCNAIQSKSTAQVKYTSYSTAMRFYEMPFHWVYGEVPGEYKHDRPRSNSEASRDRAFIINNHRIHEFNANSHAVRELNGAFHC